MEKAGVNAFVVRWLENAEVILRHLTDWSFREERMTKENSNDLDDAAKCVVSDPECSLGIAQRYLDSNPDDPNGLFSRFRALDELGEFESARADIDRVLSLAPDWSGYFARGAFFHNHGHYERAVADLTQARALDVENSGAWGICYYRADALVGL